jgi:small acid-soluble spore protein E (minor gamma-type SASP)
VNHIFLGTIHTGGDKKMAFQPKGPAQTNAQQVRQKNRQAAQQQQQYQNEFASETNPQQVRQQNQQAEARKQQNQQ